MPPKNPFLSKLRKRYNKRVVKTSKPKGYCPHSMVRYNGVYNLAGGSIWVCKICLVCLLSEDAARDHVWTCNNNLIKIEPKSPEHTDDFENTRYVCEICNRDFSRFVSLKKHEESHQPKLQQFTSSEEESDSDESYMIIID